MAHRDTYFMITLRMSGIEERISITLSSTKKEFKVRNRPMKNGGYTFVKFSG